MIYCIQKKSYSWWIVWLLYIWLENQVAIVRALQHLNVNKFFVSRTMAYYSDTDRVPSCPKSGRKKKNGNNTRNDSKSAAHISGERMQHILKNKLGLKRLKFQKAQELIDGQKKLDLKEPRSYFTCTKVASYRIWFFPMRSSSKLSSLWTNKMIGFTC